MKEIIVYRAKDKIDGADCAFHVLTHDAKPIAMAVSPFIPEDLTVPDAKVKEYMATVIFFRTVQPYDADRMVEPEIVRTVKIGGDHE